MNKILIILLCLVLLSGCVDDSVEYPLNGKESVDITLKIKVGNKTNTIAKSTTSNPNEGFKVVFNEESILDTRSDGTTPLYNLWVFQFKPDGSIEGSPKHISSTTVPVNDMTSLKVKLVPGTNQTIYIVVLGKVYGATANLASITSLTALEKWDFIGLKFVNGAYQSMIDRDDDIPYAGKVTGVNIEAIPGKTEGEITFTAPDSFLGGVEIKRLMAKIVFKYQYNVDDYQAVGVSLTNVPERISIDPSKYMTATNAKVVELTSQKSENAVGGYYTHTWYVPQNMQGTVGECSTEGSRYPANPLVPANASMIRLFANHRTDANKYLKYSIYVGQNNTSNFDIEANWQYNLITDLMLTESVAIKDRRVEGFTLNVGSRLVASEKGRIKETIGGIKDGVIIPLDNGVEMFGKEYNFDCHFDQRPLYVQAAGRKVSVRVTEGDWLKVFSYANYTEAKNAGVNFTHSEGVLIVPSELRFMVACDENLTNSSRQGKIEVITISEDEAASVVVEYVMEQNAGLNVGRIGGNIVEMSGGYGYSHDLIYESVEEYTKKYDQATTTTVTNGIYWGYKGVVPPMPNDYYSGTDNSWADIYKVKDGKELTKILSENPLNISVNGGLLPIEQQNGNLYQYNYYNSFAARICYDKNRDLNGNGVIDYMQNDDENELRWYLPTLNQLQGVHVFSNDENPFNEKYYSSDITIPATPFPLPALMVDALYMDLSYGFIRVDKRNKESGNSYFVRCVRDVPRTNNNKSIYMDRGYVTIDAAQAMPARGIVDRNAQTDFYQEVPLYEYMSSVEAQKVPIMQNGNQLTGKRILRHHPRSNGWKTINANTASEVLGSMPNRKVSKRFAVAPVNLNTNLWLNNINSEKMPWDIAAGYLITVQSAAYNVGIYGTNRGCSMYGGLAGDEKGQWRLPTYRELSLISMYLSVIVKDDYYTNSDFRDNKYFYSATELYVTQPSLAVERPYLMNLAAKTMANTLKGDSYYARCVKDL